MSSAQNGKPDSGGQWRTGIAFIRSSEEWSFAKETFKNVVIFFGWAFVALGIQTFVAWLEAEWSAGPYIVGGAVIIEVAIIVADVVWFVVRLTTDTVKTMVRSYYEVKAFAKSYSNRKTKPE